ncbi:MAG: hypothetical protein EOO63_16760 [Hymenobacter sp.]|nr:MAG: hypothetical protein EOO63_16760 [Hymenobacter sp.]
MISPDGRNLFLSSSVSGNNSSFAKIEDAKIAMVITSLNELYAHYKARGFHEVYLTIIPNPVTIVAPQMGNYNRLIERIQNNPELKMPFIDVYQRFKASKQPLYQQADTHWNYRGFRLWVEEVNKTLRKTHSSLK